MDPTVIDLNAKQKSLFFTSIKLQSKFEQSNRFGDGINRIGWIEVCDCVLTRRVLTYNENA